MEARDGDAALQLVDLAVGVLVVVDSALAGRDAELVGDLAFFVGEQMEWQGFLGLEELLTVRRVAADTNDFDALAQLFGFITEAAGLGRSAARQGGGEEEENDRFLADVVGRLPCFAVFVDAFEGRGLVADLERHGLSLLAGSGSGINRQGTKAQGAKTCTQPNCPSHRCSSKGVYARFAAVPPCKLGLRRQAGLQ